MFNDGSEPGVHETFVSLTAWPGASLPAQAAGGASGASGAGGAGLLEAGRQLQPLTVRGTAKRLKSRVLRSFISGTLGNDGADSIDFPGERAMREFL